MFFTVSSAVLHGDILGELQWTFLCSRRVSAADVRVSEFQWEMRQLREIREVHLNEDHEIDPCR